MNYRIILRMVGKIMLIEAAFMLMSLAVSLIFRESPLPFIFTITLLAAIGLPLSRLGSKNEHFFARDGFVAVAAAWLVISVFGALPFYFSGLFDSYIDCFFEAISGFTTTGSTILTDIESLPRGILFWRSFTHWLGGMGVLIFAIAVASGSSERAHHLVRAESPGPTVSRLMPKISQSAAVLYKIYISLSVLQLVLLLLAGMDLYDAAIHTFGTAGTGGFSNWNLSVGAFEDPVIEYIIGIFMLLFGVNFSVYFFIITRRFRDILNCGELFFYLGVVAASVLLIGVNIYPEYGSVEQSFRSAFFTVSSIITTTGFVTANFDLWPEFSRMIIVALMITGACSGSTGGGVKCTRVLILLKAIRRGIQQIVHPNSVKTVKADGVIVSEDTQRGVLLFFAAFVLLVILASLVVSLDNFSLTTTLSAVLTCVCNVGPGFEMVGPVGSFASFSDLSKLTLSFCMLAGRLEIFPLAVLFSPSVWRRS